MSTSLNNEEQLHTHLFAYHHGGACWGFEIQAEDPQDAKDRLAKLAYAEYQGEVYARLPASGGPLWKLLVAARNLAGALFPTKPA